MKARNKKTKAKRSEETKKAELFGQIFVYVVAIVIVSLLLVFGYKAIQVFKNKGEQVALIQFRNDLQQTVDTLSLDFGSVKIKQFSVPDAIKRVCFVNNFPELPPLSNTGFPLIEDSINSKVDKNVFLLSDTIEESLASGPIKTPTPLFCISVFSHEISLRMEGKGNHVVLSSVQS